jgi:hypothetical protein
VLLQGREKAVAEDVEGIGKEIGVFFQGVTKNTFAVLSSPKQLPLGPVLSLVDDVGAVTGGGE